MSTKPHRVRPGGTKSPADIAPAGLGRAAKVRPIRPEDGPLPPIKGFIETSFVDWDGKTAAVIFLPGCNFRCPMCHNHTLIIDPDRYQTIHLEDVLTRLRSFQGWLDGVCVTGGEPTVHPGLPRLLAVLKQEGLAVKLDTNGSRPEVLGAIIQGGLVDSVAMDVKNVLDAEFYSAAAGVEVDMDAIRQSIGLVQSAPSAEIRTTIVPGIHSAAGLRLMARELPAALPWKLQNFRPDDALHPALRQRRPFTETQFTALEQVALSTRPKI